MHQVSQNHPVTLDRAGWLVTQTQVLMAEILARPLTISFVDDDALIANDTVIECAIFESDVIGLDVLGEIPQTPSRLDRLWFYSVWFPTSYRYGLVRVLGDGYATSDDAMNAMLEQITRVVAHNMYIPD